MENKMKKTTLKGQWTTTGGSNNKPATQKQKDIIKAIAMAYRISIPGEIFRSSKKAYEFINKYKEHIQLRYGDIYIEAHLFGSFFVHIWTNSTEVLKS